jgi:hypothetical protein
MPAFVGTIQGNQLIIKVLVSKPQMPNVSTPDQKSFTAFIMVPPWHVRRVPT